MFIPPKRLSWFLDYQESTSIMRCPLRVTTTTTQRTKPRKIDQRIKQHANDIYFSLLTPSCRFQRRRGSRSRFNLFCPQDGSSSSYLRHMCCANALDWPHTCILLTSPIHNFCLLFLSTDEEFFTETLFTCGPYCCPIDLSDYIL